MNIGTTRKEASACMDSWMGNLPARVTRPVSMSSIQMGVLLSDKGQIVAVRPTMDAEAATTAAMYVHVLACLFNSINR